MSDPDVTITMRRSQWKLLRHAASSYDVRIPRDQGDGGVCLDVLTEAIVASSRPVADEKHPAA